MESDFVEVTWVYQSKGRAWISQRRLLEYGESKEGYWTSERFLPQMSSKCYKIVWIFDNSSCHNAYWK